MTLCQEPCLSRLQLVTTLRRVEGELAASEAARAAEREQVERAFECMICLAVVHNVYMYVLSLITLAMTDSVL